MHYKKLLGNRVYLSPIDIERDYLKYMEWCNKDDIDSYFIFDRYCTGNITEEQAKAKIKNYAEEDAFAIVDSSTDELIGFTGLSKTLQKNQRSNIWIQVDTGLDFEEQVIKGAEALDLLLKYCFKYLNLYSIVLECPAIIEQTKRICEESKMRYMSTRNEAVRLIDDLFGNTISYQCNPKIFKGSTYDQKKEYNLNSRVGKLILNDADLTRDIIEGDNVCLVKPTNIDIDKEATKIIEFMSNSIIAEPLGEFKSNWTIESAKEYLKKAYYAIVLNDNSNKLIGAITLFDKNERNRTASLETVIGDPDLHGKGLGKESKKLFLEEIYTNGIYNSILSSVFSYNAKSIGVNEHLGFNLMGLREQAYFAQGYLNDMKLYEMNRNLYNQNNIREIIGKKILQKQKTNDQNNKK